jgi:hypothetical protein
MPWHVEQLSPEASGVNTTGVFQIGQTKMFRSSCVIGMNRNFRFRLYLCKKPCDSRLLISVRQGCGRVTSRLVGQFR